MTGNDRRGMTATSLRPSGISEFANSNKRILLVAPSHKVNRPPLRHVALANLCQPTAFEVVTSFRSQLSCQSTSGLRVKNTGVVIRTIWNPVQVGRQHVAGPQIGIAVHQRAYGFRREIRFVPTASATSALAGGTGGTLDWAWVRLRQNFFIYRTWHRRCLSNLSHQMISKRPDALFRQVSNRPVMRRNCKDLIPGHGDGGHGIGQAQPLCRPLPPELFFFLLAF